MSIQSRALRARRHRQDPSRGRVGQARVHARDTGRVLHHDRAAHAAAQREAGGPARRGAPADRQGEVPDHRRVRLHADRRGGLQVPVPGHIGFLRDPECHLYYEHRVLCLGRVLGDKNMAAVLIDRTVHHGRLTGFEGGSYRSGHTLMTR